jgi:hypothetical protein
MTTPQTPEQIASSLPSRPQTILAGLRKQNEPAEFKGRKGFWVQGDCIFIEADSPQAAIVEYRKTNVAISHNHFCGSIMREKERVNAVTKSESDLAEMREERDRVRKIADSAIKAAEDANAQKKMWKQACADLRGKADGLAKAAEKQRAAFSNAQFGHALICNAPTRQGFGSGRCNCGMADLQTAFTAYRAAQGVEGDL